MNFIFRDKFVYFLATNGDHCVKVFEQFITVHKLFWLSREIPDKFNDECEFFFFSKRSSVFYFGI